MGGGAVPPPATTASHHLSRPPSSSPFSSNFRTQSYYLADEIERKASEYSNQTNFGHVPSQIEVQNAISDLQRVMNATNSEITLAKSLGQKRLIDAYHLLQTDASLQRLVISISSDTDVWDAILKNDAVQDLHGSLPQTESREKDTSYKQDSESTSLITRWIFAFMKSKFIDFIEKLEGFVTEILYSMSKNKKHAMSEVDDILEEKVRSSLLLSVIILVIIVVTRRIEA